MADIYYLLRPGRHGLRRKSQRHFGLAPCSGIDAFQPASRVDGEVSNVLVLP
jgi:hypothetical protein